MTSHSSKDRRRTLGRVGFLLTCLLAVGVLAGAAWGTFHLMRPVKADSSGEAGVTQWYQDPMHPWLIAPHPGPAPDCGMPMVPLDPAKFTSDIAVDPVTVQNIGIQTTPARRGPVIRHIRALGEIQYDQARLYDVNVKVDGWITQLNVDSIGAVVHQGDPLFVLDSPELYSAKQNYLISRRAMGGAADSHFAPHPGPLPEGEEDDDHIGGPHPNPLPEEQRVGEALLDAAREKLEYLGFSLQQIEALTQRGKATRLTTVYSPYAGVVVKKGVVQGSHITPGTLAYRIADMSKVWVIASVVEVRSPRLHAGQAATMTLDYLPGKVFRGTVQYVYPYLDAASHKVKLRVVFDNSTGELKPGMFATVTLDYRSPGEATLVPRRAVLDTGERKLVFVSTGEGHFEPREVVTGMSSGDGWVQIKQGVKAGEEVVTSGAFLLGSESTMREALARMIHPQPTSRNRSRAMPDGMDMNRHMHTDMHTDKGTDMNMNKRDTTGHAHSHDGDSP